MLKANQITPEIPMMTQEERMELKELSQELFGGMPFVVFTPDLPLEKVKRYDFLVKKKMDCIRALMN